MKYEKVKERLELLKRYSDEARSKHRTDYEAIRAFVAGDQRVKLQSLGKRYGKRYRDPEDWEPTFCFNFMQDQARNTLALYISTQAKATCQARPPITEDSLQKARGGTIVFDDFWRRKMIREKVLQRLIWEMVQGFTTILRLDWDPWLGDIRELPVLDNDDQPVVAYDPVPVFDHMGQPRFNADGSPMITQEARPIMEERPAGDIRCRILTMFDLNCDPSKAVMADMHDVVHTYYVDPWQWESRWGKTKAGKKVQPSSVKFDEGIRPSDVRFSEEGEKLYRVTEYFRRPDPEHPLGWRCVFGGTEFEKVEDGDLERWPFCEMQSMPAPDDFWGMNPLLAAIDYQVAHNDAMNRVEHTGRLTGHPMMEEIGPTNPTEEKGRIPSIPGGLIPKGYRPVPPQAIPYSMMQWPQQLYEGAQAATGVTSAMMGKEANPHASGRLQGMLEDAALRVFVPTGEIFEAFIEQVGTLTLDLLWEFGPERLQVTPTAGMSKDEPMILTRDAWEAGTVVVRTGSGIPKNKAIRQQFVMQVVEMGLTQDMSPRTVRELLEVPTLDTDLDQLGMIKRWMARRINQMEEGVPWDLERERDLLDPEVAYMLLRERMVCEKFETYAPQVQDLFFQTLQIVVQMHQQFMQGLDPYGQQAGGGAPEEGAAPPEQEGVQIVPGVEGQPMEQSSLHESMGVSPRGEIFEGFGDLSA